MKGRNLFPIMVIFFVLVLVTALIRDAGAPGRGSAMQAVYAAGGDEELDRSVFPKDEVIDVKITIDEDDFLDMLDNASAEEMKPASVEYNGIKLDNVGIRTKGNLSLRSVVNSDSDRYSFKLSFDEYISSQTLQGISKINLNNNYSDATSMREFLTYELAEEMGLPTPKFSYVNVYVNGELWGFYLAIEQVGDAYLERHFGNAYGALYKAEFGGMGGVFPGGGAGGAGVGRSSGGGDLVWQGDEIDSYSSLVRKSKSSNGDILIDMLDELNNGSDYEKVLDVENALEYIALNAVTVNMDSYLGSNQQNYYLYEDDGIFSVLPWDYNMAFGGMGGGSEQIMIDEPTQGAMADRPLVAKLLAVDEYKEKYHDIIRRMVEGYLSDEAFAARVKQIQELISPYVKQDPRPFYSYEQYESAIPQLVSFTQGRVENVKGQLAGTIASSGDGSGSGGGMGGFGGGFGGFGETGGQQGQGMRNGRMNAQANEQAAWRPAGQGAAGSGGDAVLAADTPQSPGQGGMTPPDGQGQNGQGGFGGVHGEFPGRGQGGFGGMPGMGGGIGTNPSQGDYRNAATTGIALVALLVVGLFVAFYKRRRL